MADNGATATDRRRLWESNDTTPPPAIAVEVFDDVVTLGIHNTVAPFGAWRLVDLQRDDVVTLVSALSRWLDEHPPGL